MDPLNEDCAPERDALDVLFWTTAANALTDARIEARRRLKSGRISTSHRRRLAVLDRALRIAQAQHAAVCAVWDAEHPNAPLARP